MVSPLYYFKGYKAAFHFAKRIYWKLSMLFHSESNCVPWERFIFHKECCQPEFTLGWEESI